MLSAPKSYQVRFGILVKARFSPQGLRQDIANLFCVVGGSDEPYPRHNRETTRSGPHES
jgi:hypothetical protein